MTIRESTGGGELVVEPSSVRLNERLGTGPRSDGILVVVVTFVSVVFSSFVGVLHVLEAAVLLSSSPLVLEMELLWLEDEDEDEEEELEDVV